jgi:lysophospholipase L1-like esterase
MSEPIIVMLGDSLTEFNIWDKISKNHTVINQGCSGDTTAAIFFRLRQTYHAKPTLVFLQAGINDLSQGRSPTEVLEGHQTIWNAIFKNLPLTQLVVCSLVPVNSKMFGWVSQLNNDLIRKTNGLLEKEALTKNLDFIDLFSPLMGDNPELPENLTQDGVHLTALAYQSWIKTLQNYLDKLKT